MGKVYVFAVIIIFIGNFAMADDIHLKNNSILKGKIIGITDKELRYHKINENVDTIIPIEKIVKVTYDDSRTISFQKEKQSDRIFLFDGHIIKGNVTRITKKYIAYTQEKQHIEQILPRNITAKIMFSNGRSLELKEDVKVQQEKKQTIPANKTSQKSRSYTDIPKVDDTDRGIKYFAGIGVKVVKWVPMWRSISTYDNFGTKIYHLNVDMDVTAEFGPELAVQITPEFMVSMNFYYGYYGVEENFFGVSTYDYDLKIQCHRFESEILLWYLFNDFIHFYLGPRYIGHSMKLEDKFIHPMFMMIYIVEYESVMYNFGPKAGIEFVLPIIEDFYFVQNISGSLMYGAENMSDRRALGTGLYSVGIEAGFKYFIKPIRTWLHLYGYYNYEHYFSESYDFYDKDDAHWFGCGFLVQYQF